MNDLRPTIPEKLAAKARSTLGRAVDHAIGIQLDDGSWHEPVSPRIFDSAIVTCAMKSTRAPIDLRPTTAWIAEASPHDQHPGARDAEEWLKDAALAPERPPPIPASAAMDIYGSRSLLIQALGAAQGAPGAKPADLLVAVNLRLNAGRRIRRWRHALLIAAHIIALSAQGRSCPSATMTSLLDLQDADGGFCKMPTISAIALMALRAAAQGTAAAQRCQEYLLRAREPDGTWRFISSDNLDTAFILQRLRGHPRFDTQCRAAGESYLRDHQSPEGGWSFRSGLECENDTSAVVLSALAGTDAGAASWPKAEEYLARTQRTDGMWTTWQSTDDTAGQDVVAHLIQATEAYGSTRIETGRARRWLREKAKAGWSAEWYSPPAYAIAEVSAAVGWNDPLTQNAVRQLAAQQNPDGGWAAFPDGPSCASATGLALTAITRSGIASTTDSLTAAIDYLSEAQESGGRWPSVAVVYGPRPFLADYPAHSHAFTCGGLRDLSLPHAKDASQ